MQRTCNEISNDLCGSRFFIKFHTETISCLAWLFQANKQLWRIGYSYNYNLFCQKLKITHFYQNKNPAIISVTPFYEIVRRICANHTVNLKAGKCQ